jgi:hypothetical protein
MRSLEGREGLKKVEKGRSGGVEEKFNNLKTASRRPLAATYSHSPQVHRTFDPFLSH